QIGDVADDHLAWTIHLDISFQQQIGAHPLSVPGVSRAGHKTPWLDCHQFQFTHQTLHAPASDPFAVAFGLQFILDLDRHSSGSITAGVAPEGRLYSWGEILRRLWAGGPSIVASAADSQHPAEFDHRVIGGFVRDELMNQVHVCRLKSAKAFFKMSRSISTCLS